MVCWKRTFASAACIAASASSARRTCGPETTCLRTPVSLSNRLMKKRRDERWRCFAGWRSRLKHLSEYRDPRVAADLVAAIRRAVTREWRVMEICGGQTHSIVRNGLDVMVAPHVSFIHGPGCP